MIAEETFPANVVSCGLRFAMPMVFDAWAGNSLYLSLVPAYLPAALHASDPLVGAGSFVAEQAATAAASIRFGAIAPERRGVVAPFFVVFGLAVLVTGTNANSWWLIGVATILVGAGGGVASGARSLSRHVSVVDNVRGSSHACLSPRTWATVFRHF